MGNQEARVEAKTTHRFRASGRSTQVQESRTSPGKKRKKPATAVVSNEFFRAQTVRPLLGVESLLEEVSGR